MIGGCPCGTHGPCCDDVSTFTPDHDCTASKEVCEGCYCTGCLNCGKECHCEL